MNLYLLAAGALLATTPAVAEETSSAAVENGAPAVVADAGFYAGIYLGYGWTKPDFNEPDDPGYGRNPTVDGLAAGLLAGYDFAVGRVAVAIEGDFGMLGGDEEDSDSAPNNFTAFDNKWDAHLRAKVGVPVGSIKLFAAGGLAIARLESDDTDPTWGRFNKTYKGWTLGGGIERRLGTRFTGRVEYLHDEFGKESGEVRKTPVGQYAVTQEPSSDLIRLAVLFSL